MSLAVVLCVQQTLCRCCPREPFGSRLFLSPKIDIRFGEHLILRRPLAGSRFLLPAQLIVFVIPAILSLLFPSSIISLHSQPLINTSINTITNNLSSIKTSTNNHCNGSYQADSPYVHSLPHRRRLVLVACRVFSPSRHTIKTSTPPIKTHLLSSSQVTNNHLQASPLVARPHVSTSLPRPPAKPPQSPLVVSRSLTATSPVSH